VKTGHSPAVAITSGYQDAFWALIGLALLGALAALVLLRGTKIEIVEGEPVAVS
jgi:hypothetical protein